MKLIKRYYEKSNVTDMSKDRFILDCSYQEFEKIRRLADLARFSCLLVDDIRRLHNLGYNIQRSLQEADKTSKCEWI